MERLTAAQGDRTGTILGIMAILLWSSTLAIGRSLVVELGPLRSAAAVYTFSAILALAFLLVRPQRLRSILQLPRKYLAFCGGLFVFYVVCIYLALGLATGSQQAIEVGTINYLWPAATVVLSVPILGVRTSRMLIPGTALVLAGLVLATLPIGTWSGRLFLATLRGNWLPYVLALVAALAWALYSNLSRLWAAGAGANAVPVFMIATSVVTVPLALLYPSVEARWSTQTIVEIAFLGLFPTTLGYAFWEVAMRRGNLVLVATLSYFIPVISAAVAALYLHSLPGVWFWLGCALIVTGSWLCASARKDHP